LPDATDQTLILADLQPEQSGSYSVIVSNQAGTVRSSEAIVLVGDPPQIVSEPSDLVLLEGEPAQFAIDVSGSAPLAYQWYSGNNALPAATSATLDFPAVNYLDNGQYHVTVSNLFGSASSRQATLRVLVLPNVLSMEYKTGGVTITFDTIPNLFYTVYFAEDLNEPVWIPMPKGTRRPGTGAPLTVKDSEASPQARFYRIRVE
jgi:hypothetical protein